VTTAGIVREWHSAEGWGVIDSDSTPGGCWTHFGSVNTSGYRALRPGQPVWFEFETGPQDGYAYRAVTVWTGDDRTAPATDDVRSAAFHSTLSLRFDPPADRDS